MSITARKQRERTEMRQLILDAARSIFLEKGYDHTSIRNIAERIDYSPGTIYLYFKEKDDIFHALHEEGFRRLLESMQPLLHVQDPMERLKAMGRLYIEFALKNKDFYDLMFIMQAPMNMEKDPCNWEMGSHTLDLLKSVIRDCQKAGYFKGKDAEDLSFMVWSNVHGMAALYCRNRCQVYENREALDLVEKAFVILSDMLERI